MTQGTHDLRLAETRLTRIEAIVTMHTWMLGVVIAGIIAVVAMDVQILLRLPHA